MPQTKFVLKKAIELNLIPVVVINKIDKDAAEPDRVLDEVFDLLVALDASEEQLEFPVLYAAARNGYAKLHMEDENVNMEPLFEAILEHVPSPSGSADNDTQVQVFTLDNDNFVVITSYSIHYTKLYDHTNEKIIINLYCDKI